MVDLLRKGLKQLVPLILKMTERDRRLFACDCAERVLPFYDEKILDAYVMQEAIDVARRYARGQADNEELAQMRLVVQRRYLGFREGHPARFGAQTVRATVARRSGDLEYAPEWRYAQLKAGISRENPSALLALEAAFYSMKAVGAQHWNIVEQHRHEGWMTFWQTVQIRSYLDDNIAQPSAD